MMYRDGWFSLSTPLLYFSFLFLSVEVVTWPEIGDGQMCRGVNDPGTTLNQ